MSHPPINPSPPNPPAPTPPTPATATAATPGDPPAAGPTAVDLAAMARALELAFAAASMGEVPVGAVVYRCDTGQVLGEGHNRRETDRDPLAHAEVLAIRAAASRTGDWRLTGMGLAVTLEPCPMCAGAVVHARLERLVIGAPDPKAGACGSLIRLTQDPRLNHRVSPIAGVMAEESAALLRGFFRALRAGAQPPATDDAGA